MSKCPSCGAELKYDVNSAKVTCDYCKCTFDPKTLEVKTKVAKVREQYEGKSFHCTQCGARLLTFDETAITFCSYCGSQTVIEEKMIKQNNPDYIIPFKKSKEECIANYRKKLKKALFVPKYMKEDLVVDKFRGIFMPYCIYKTSFHGLSSNNGSKYSHRSGNYDYYDDYTIKAQVDADYEGISYDLLSKFSDDYSTAIPFSFDEVEKFNKNYLMGFYADTIDVDGSVYDVQAEAISTVDSTSHLRKRREFSKYGCHNPKVGLKVSDRKIGMFPVYFLAIRTKDNKNVHYAVVNGQTGQVAADLPIDFKKYIIGTLILAIIVFALLSFASVILPIAVVIFAFIASIISIIISNSQLNKIFDKENNLSDKGFQYKKNTDEEKNESKETSESDSKEINANANETIVVEKKNKVKKEKKIKMPFKDKFKYIYKQLIAMFIAIVIIILKPVNDAYYYGAAIISLGIIIIAFKDLIKEHNLLTSNKLPQLEKRGGDEK